MEEDDEIRSRQSGSPSPPRRAADNGRIAGDLAGASTESAALPLPPPQSGLTLALPIQQARHHPAAPSGGGGREDCWSEDSTGVLIGAWGERYLELSRGNLKEKHWKEVAEIVSGRAGRSRPPRTHIQCKYRIDTVKRKYKMEKAKAAAGQGPSKWVFYETLERIIGPAQAQTLSTLRPSPDKTRRQPVPPQRPLRPQLQLPNSDSDTESDKSADVLAKSHPPPPQPHYPTPRRADRMKGREEGEGKGVGELMMAVKRFVEVYERAETGKMRQAVEMEKQRMKFVEETEVERMQLLMTAQVEISKMRRRLRQRGGRKKGGAGVVPTRN